MPILDNIIRALYSVALEQVYHPDLSIQEHAFAYELYHQLRLREERGDLDIEPAKIHGELNKRAQTYFGDGEAIPDLLMHDPYSNNSNLAVIEIKRARRSRNEIQEDLHKLTKFVREPLEYEERILIVSGPEPQRLNHHKQWIENVNETDGVDIAVILHTIPEEIETLSTLWPAS
jgi:hypothetical protein